MPSLPLLALGSVYIGQGNMSWVVGSLVFFHDFLFLLTWLFGRMESMDAAGVLQEAGDADSRACTRSQVWVEKHHSLNFHIYYIVQFMPKISWSLYCYFKWWGKRKVGGWFIYVRVWLQETRGGYHIFSIFCSPFVLPLIVLPWLVHDSLLCLFHCSFFAFFVSGSFN